MTTAAIQTDLFAEVDSHQPPANTTSTDSHGRTTTTSTKTIPVLYRCRDCERRTKTSQVWRSSFKRTTISTEWWNPSVHKLVRFVEITWSRPDGRTLRGDYAPALNCPACKRPTSGQPIRDTFNANRRCDARCIYAKGPNCECSCNGANHGAGHSHD